MAEVVTIQKNNKKAQVVKSSFENVWKNRGWSIVQEEDAARPQSGPTSTPPPKTKSDDKS